MRTVRVIAFFAIVGALLNCVEHPIHGQQPAAAVNVKIVKYDELCEIIAANKGKVILIDFWSTTCVPCVESFFHTVEMANTYRDKGLVVISVSTFQLRIPGAKEDDVKKQVLAFLQSHNATFINVILDEPIDVVRNKTRIGGLPCLYVFNREGQWTQFDAFKLSDLRDEKHRHPTVEQYVKYCLNQPAK